LILLASLTVVMHRRGYFRLQYPSLEEYPIRGVDVSHHQRAIEWPRLVKSSEISFAFIKATEGTDLQDPRFQQNWRDSKGLVSRGAYHFFTFCSSGEAQARNFLTVAEEGGELPRAVDVEFGGNCRSWASHHEIRRELEVFVEAITRADGRPPVLYLTRASFNRIVRGHFRGVPLWIREVVWRPSADDYPNFWFWQYAGNGRLEGVETLIDLNVFMGDRAAFNEIGK
jgi:lysozyme